MDEQNYRLDEQVGFLLRRVNQRHLSVFAEVITEVTTTQFAALAKLAELGPMSQNQLGRATAMDAATIKGVVGRLVHPPAGDDGAERGGPPPADRRTDRRRAGRSSTISGAAGSRRRSATLAPLAPAERERFLTLLRQLT